MSNYNDEILNHYGIAKTAGQYDPSRLWGSIGSLRLFSAFQVLGGLPVSGVSKKDALKIISRMTALRIPSSLRAPNSTSKWDLEKWLDWLSDWAVNAGQMEWQEPYAWAVPAATKRGWFW